MEIGITTIILAATLFFLVTEKIPMDLTAMGIMVALVLTGILSPPQAVAGFANPAVVTVGANVSHQPGHDPHRVWWDISVTR